MSQLKQFFMFFFMGNLTPHQINYSQAYVLSEDKPRFNGKEQQTNQTLSK